MLQSTVTVADSVDQKHVAIERRRCSEELDMGLTESAQVFAQTIHVRFMAPADGDGVRYTAGLELGERECPYLDGMVDQLVVVGRAIDTEAIGWRVLSAQRRSHAPGARLRSSRRQNCDVAGALLLAKHSQKYARTVEEAACGIEIGTANGQIVCVHLHRDRHRSVGRRGDPGVFVELRDRQCMAPALRPYGSDVTCAVADQIAPWDPGRKLQARAVRVRVAHCARDSEETRFETLRAHGVLQRRFGHWRLNCR